jgi:hypothetical protein
MVAPAIVGAAAVLAAGGIAASALGASKAGENETARRLREEAIRQFSAINIPNPESMYAKLENLVQQGVLDPEEIPTIFQDPTTFNEIIENPIYLQAQQSALGQLSQIAEEGGLTATDRARIRATQDEFRTTERGSREALDRRAAELGIAGSDYNLLSQQIAGQSAADRASREGTDIAALAEQRALEAIMNKAGVAGQIGSQEYGKMAEKARAQDAIAAFNAANRQSVAGENVMARNVAQAQNLAEKQRLADENIRSKNIEEVRRKDLIQKNYENALRRAAGMTQQYSEAASAAQGAQDRQAAMLGGLGSGLLSTSASLFGQGTTSTGDKKKEDTKKFAEGGIVTEPTNAIIGEKGPEYVVPSEDLEKADPDLKYRALMCAIEHLSKRLDHLED